MTQLRLVLRANATTSVLTGLLAAIAPGPVDDLLGTGQESWVQLVGLGLVLFAGVVVATSMLGDQQLAKLVPAISLGDGSWVVGTVLAIALGWFSAGGAIVMSLIGLMVGGFAVAQTQLLRQRTV